MPRATRAAAPPEGLVHVPDLIDVEEHDAALGGLERLRMEEVRMRGQVARRIVQHFGWRYDYETHAVVPAAPLPAYLEPVRTRAAGMAGLEEARLEQVLVTCYPPGATIGWHRDAPLFGTVIGVSLASACRMRFRRGAPGAWEVYEIALEPRSGYVLAGDARTRWQHGIPGVADVRWSVTFRTLRRRPASPA
jgi:alkylated DNA repair protein (DNA oxidative demethylase)